MKIIDRYLLRQFAQVYVICFVSLTGLFVVFDAFGNLDEFQRHSAKGARPLLPMMGEYYAYRTLHFFEHISGSMTVIAAMFTVAWIQRYHELMALLAAGISKVRVIMPIVAASAVLSGAAAANRELVIPRFRHQLSRTPKDLLGENAQAFHPRYDNQTNILFRAKDTFAREERLNEVSLLLPPELDSLGKQLVGQNAFYQRPTRGRPGGYLIQGVSQPAGLTASPSLKVGGRPLILTPLDHPQWLAADECFVVSDVNFEQLKGGQAWRQLSSTAELVKGLANRSLDFGADVRVTIHSRFVHPLLDMNLLLLGLPLLLGRQQRNVFVSIGLCCGVVAAFMLVVIAMQYLGTIYYLDPAKSAWLPLAIFAPAAVFLFDRIRQ